MLLGSNRGVYCFYLALVQRESVETDLPLRTAYNASRGFFIQMTVGGRGAQQMPDSFPETFIKVVKTKNTVSATTEDLVSRSSSIRYTLISRLG